MKFDFIVGNPPYHENYAGESSGANSIYDCFIDVSFALADVVELITPARFLFNAGSTSKKWNLKMLTDPHFKVLKYESNSKVVFPTLITPITGGVVITIHNLSKDYGAIGTFTAYEELQSILSKVKNHNSFEGIDSIMVTSFAYHFTQKMHDDFPQASSLMSKGHAFDLKSSVFEKLDMVFHDEEPDDGFAYINILGRYDGKRAYRYIRRDYVNDVKNLDYYKVVLSKADGAAGTIGMPIPARIVGVPTVESPKTGMTESFLSLGCFENETEAINAATYIKTRFCRALLSVLKATQDVTPSKWKYVPLQDFTEDSDIDWSQSISEIDQQLYKKYSLTKQEINFIETYVKEMN